MSNQVHPISQNSVKTDEVDSFGVDEKRGGKLNAQPTQHIEGQVVYNISKYHEEQKIDYTKFQNKIDSLHLRKADNKEYSIWEDLVCGTKIPGHFLWSTSEKTAVDDLGVGITLYFKGLKNLIWLHLVFIIISMPSFIMYSQYNADAQNGVNDFQHGLFISSVGNLGKEISKPYQECLLGDFKQSSDNEEVHLSCKAGVFNFESKKRGLDIYLILQSNMNHDFKMCDKEVNGSATRLEASDKQTQIFDSTLYKECDNKKGCTVHQQDIFDFVNNIWQGYKDDSDYQNTKDKQYAIQIECIAEYEEKGNTKFIAAYLDAIILIVYFAFIFIQGRAEKKCTENILNKKLTPSRFSIQISNLPPKKDYKEKTENGMKAEIHSFLEQFLGNKYTEGAITDVKISESQSEILNKKKIGELQKKNEQNIYEFLKSYDSTSVITNRDSVKVDQLQQVISSLAENNRSKANKKLDKIMKVDESINKSYELVKQAEDTSYIRYAWVTFNTLKLKEDALSKLQMTSWQRFIAKYFTSCVSTTKLPYFNNALIKAKESPNPDTILWQNNYARFVKLRRIVSTLIIIGVVILSFLFISLMSEEEKALKKDNPPVNCVLPQFADIFEESGKKKIIDEHEGNHPYSEEPDTGYIQCFCKQRAFTSLDSPLDAICQKWLDAQVQMYSIFVGTALVVVVITAITQIILGYLMTFERFRQSGNQMKSVMTKTFIVNFINNGLIVFFVNMYIGVEGIPYMFNGEYDATDTKWFRDVGTVIVLSILISAAKLIFGPIISILLKKLIQFYDRKFQSSNPRVTRQTKQEDWVEKYTGPEFDISMKSATILTFCCLGSVYAGGFPILYCITFVGLLAQYWFDKIQLFKYCRKPLNYDEKLATEFRSVLYFLPFIHCLFSLFVFGCDEIFQEDRAADGEEDNIETIADTFLLVLFERKQTIVHCIILLSAVAIYVINTFLLGPLMKVKEFFFKSKAVSQQTSSDEESKKLEKTFDQYLSYEQICDEVNLIHYYQEQHKNNEDQESDQFLKYVSQKLKQYESAKEQQKSSPKTESDIIGIYSYDLRINPIYRNYFCWEKLEK